MTKLRIYRRGNTMVEVWRERSLDAGRRFDFCAWISTRVTGGPWKVVSMSNRSATRLAAFQCARRQLA